jgi:phenylacetate-CoA ligase
LTEIQAIPEEEYFNYIDSRRWEIVNYHLEHSPFYSRLIGNKMPDSWEQIPIMKKSDLQQPLDRRLAKNFSKSSVYINKTSGSSGHPFVFAKDKLCHALTWAEIMDRFSWHGINFQSDLQARFYGIPLEFAGYWKERFKDYLSNRYRFAIFDLSEDKLARFFETFKQKPFAFINGYTSSIVAFANYLEGKNVILREACPTLRCCIVTSEILFEDDRLLMERVFGVPVVNEYGASELDLIAFENKERDFIVNSETLYVEIVSDEGMPVPNGTEGRVIVTSLYNRAHPMIRYDLGDIGVLHPSGTSKRPLLKELTGRTNDFALLPNGKKVPGLAFYYVTKSAIKDHIGVREFVVEQKSPSSFIIRYVAGIDFTDSIKKSIAKALNDYVGNDLDLVFVRESSLERTARGKLRQFSRSF